MLLQKHAVSLAHYNRTIFLKITNKSVPLTARPETFVEPQMFQAGKSPAAETSEMSTIFPA